MLCTCLKSGMDDCLKSGKQEVMVVLKFVDYGMTVTVTIRILSFVFRNSEDASKLYEIAKFLNEKAVTKVRSKSMEDTNRCSMSKYKG